MNEPREQQNELISRLDLIETMMKEGRCVIEYWGWSQVLWGTAYLIAIGWSHSAVRPVLAWPVTTVAAAIVTAIVANRKRRANPLTTTTRALRGVWIAVGTALFLFCFSVGLGGHYESHSYMAAVEVLLGVAYFSCAMVLRWRAQFAAAIIWWTAAVATCFAPDAWVTPIFVIATIFGMVGLGLYLMYSEHRDKQRIVSHA